MRRLGKRWWWLFSCCPLSAAGQQELPPAAVVVVAIIEREVAAGQSFVGQLLPVRRSVVGSAVEGRVMELLFDDGDAVGPAVDPNPADRNPADRNPADRNSVDRNSGNSGRFVGQPIVQLLTDTISIEIDAARAAEDLRRQELAELQAGTRAEELTQALARLEGAQAVMDFTQLQLVRFQTLFEKSNSATKEQLDESLANAISARKNHIAAKAAYEMAAAGPRKEQIAQAVARLAVATEEVRRLEDQRGKYTIRAPFAGHVVAKMTEVGAWLSRGDPVAEVIALDPVEVEVAVPEAVIVFVKPRAPVQVHVDAVRDQVFAGEVARIIPQADARSRTFPVKVRLANPVAADGSHLLKAGMLARTTFAVGSVHKALLVPKDALVLGGPEPVVMVVRTDPQTKHAVAAAVPVQLGIADGGWIQVQGDLQAGQSVIVIGNERVRGGQKVVASQRSAEQP